MRLVMVAVFVFWSCGVLSPAGGGEAWRDEIDSIVETDSGAGESITKLRAAGPTALEALFAYREQLAGPDGSEATGETAIRLQRLNAAIDRVGGARHCSVSRLYWYTGLERAREAAEKSGKPILSLHMMGQLTDELSCANSRFFRTALYANAAVAAVLRDEFVLHWHSVRPVPKVTVDFGDGRKLERTLTGNSIHYVLTSDGWPVDGLPGLYGPDAFLQHVRNAAELARGIRTLAPQARGTALAQLHHRQLEALTTRWMQDLQQVAPQVPADEPLNAVLEKFGAAEAAASIAQPKAIVEMPLITSVTLNPFALLAVDPQSLERATTPELWQKLALLHADQAHLDESSVALMSRHLPAVAADAVSPTKSLAESPLLKMVDSFERSMALDTVRNEYLLHRQIHEWYVKREVTSDVTALNERVYDELFLTPSSDPWLGLVRDDTYTALDDSGIVSKD